MIRLDGTAAMQRTLPLRPFVVITGTLASALAKHTGHIETLFSTVVRSIVETVRDHGSISLTDISVMATLTHYSENELVEKRSITYAVGRE